MNTTHELELARRYDLAVEELRRAGRHEETLRLTRDQIAALEATAELSRRARDASIWTLDRLGIARKAVLDRALVEGRRLGDLPADASLLADVATTVVDAADAGTVNRVTAPRGEEPFAGRQINGKPVDPWPILKVLLAALRDREHPRDVDTTGPKYGLWTSYGALETIDDEHELVIRNGPDAVDGEVLLLELVRKAT